MGDNEWKNCTFTLERTIFVSDLNDFGCFVHFCYEKHRK